MTDHVPLSRREFVRLSAATAGALTLGGEATAAVSHAKMDRAYEFVQSYTPVDHAVPTLVTFSAATGTAAMDALVDDAITTRKPRPAGYATLTATQAEAVAELPTAETLSHSPGSNPFWRLGYYPLGVFPAARRSVDFIDYEQMISGMEHLETEHPDRLNVYSIGESPGHYNYLTDRQDPKGVYVAEVTNDVPDRGEQLPADKEQIFLSLSLHGLERAGVEAGARFIEELLTSREREMETLLDDVVFVFVFSNPDGWVAKHPQYDSGWQAVNPDGAPVLPFYERGNAGVADTNRHYPIAGWITTDHYPGEPNGAPERSATRVPDTIAIVEHFRDSGRYTNLNYGADLHGMLNGSNFVLGLISQDRFDQEQLHELYQMNRAVDAELEANLSPWIDVAGALSPLSDQTGGNGVIPTQAFDYAGIWDTLGYTDSGFMGDWMAHPREAGGLGLTSMDFEMAYSHMVGANGFDPELVRMQVVGYQTAIRSIAEYAVQASDTRNTADQFGVDIETGGDSVAYVTTDALTRSSDDLEFGDTQTTNDSQTLPVGVGESAAITHEVREGTDALTVHVHAHDALYDVALRSPAGEVVQSSDATDGDRLGGKCCGHGKQHVTDPEAGTWTVELAHAFGEAGQARVNVATLAAAQGAPDPKAALGYDQRDYEVTPFTFFDDLEAYVGDGGTFDAVSVSAANDGALVDGGAPAYDHVVVIHDHGLETGVLDDYVDAGGNLLLTDTGLHHLAAMDNGRVRSGDFDGAVSDETFYIGHLASKNLDHPLLAAEHEDGEPTPVRPIQQCTWKIVPLGYSIDTEAPMTLVDQAAFEAAGGSVAGTTGGAVSAGSIADADGTGIHVVGSLLPPASQGNLHPFGLLDYSVSFLGYLLVTNALGFQQVRQTADGELRFGRTEWAGPGGGGGSAGLSGSGSRADDGSVFTGGQTNQVNVTVSSVSQPATVTDEVPTGWTVVAGGQRRGDSRVVELGTVTPAETPTTLTYYAEAPESAPGVATFGPARVEADEQQVSIAGTDDNVVGPSQNPSTGL